MDQNGGVPALTGEHIAWLGAITLGGFIAHWLATGRVQLALSGVARREEKPVIYWAMVALYGFAFIMFVRLVL